MKNYANLHEWQTSVFTHLIPVLVTALETRLNWIVLSFSGRGTLSPTPPSLPRMRGFLLCSTRLLVLILTLTPFREGSRKAKGATQARKREQPVRCCFGVKKKVL